jgi:hypothetical protein
MVISGLATFVLALEGWGSVATLLLTPAALAFWYVVFARRYGREVWSWASFEDFLRGWIPRGGLMPPPFFFLSYTRDNVLADRDRILVERFYRELEGEVRQRLPVKLEKCGEWDRSLREGEAWKIKLLQSLNSCKVLVALCSPGYDASDNCLQEAEFARLRARLQPSASTPIVKVQWRIGGGKTGFLHELQDSSATQFPAYREKGMLQLMEEEHREYREVLKQKAAAIADLTVPTDPYAWECPSFSPTAIDWSRGLSVVRRLGQSAAVEVQPVDREVSSVQPQAPARGNLAPGVYLATVAIVTALGLRASILIWGDMVLAQNESVLKTRNEHRIERAFERTQRVRTILSGALAPKSILDRADDDLDALAAAKVGQDRKVVK